MTDILHGNLLLRWWATKLESNRRLYEDAVLSFTKPAFGMTDVPLDSRNGVQRVLSCHVLVGATDILGWLLGRKSDVAG